MGDGAWGHPQHGFPFFRRQRLASRRPQAWCFPLAPEPWSRGHLRAYPGAAAAPLLGSAAAAVPRSEAGGPGVGPAAPKLVSLQGRIHHAKAGPSDPTFLLLSFSAVATGFFSPPNEGEGERVFGGLRQGRNSDCLLGSWPDWQAGSMIFVYTGCQCLFSVSVCLLHTPPFTDSLTHPSFMLPLRFLRLSSPSLCFLVPAAPLPGSGRH